MQEWRRNGASLCPSTRRPGTSAGAARTEEGLWVAVLPFKITASDKELEALADGLTEDVTAGLSRFPYIRVVAYNSAMVYKNRSTDIRAVGRELSARYVIDGSIRRGERALRINTQLVDAVSGASPYVWELQYASIGTGNGNGLRRPGMCARHRHHSWLSVR